jgi:hypothetical protein
VCADRSKKRPTFIKTMFVEKTNNTNVEGGSILKFVFSIMGTAHESLHIEE